jgi:hypothetical protein
MDTALTDAAAIGRYLRSLRDIDRAALAGDGDVVAAERLIDAHTLLMAHGGGEPVEESLATWISLLDDESWRERVRAVRVDLSLLREPAEQELLARVRAGVAPVAV